MIEDHAPEAALALGLERGQEGAVLGRLQAAQAGPERGDGLGGEAGPGLDHPGPEVVGGNARLALDAGHRDRGDAMGAESLWHFSFLLGKKKRDIRYLRNVE